MSGVVTLTINPAVDKSCEVDSVTPNSKLRCRRPIFYPGGGGLNVIRAMRNLGETALGIWTRGGPAGEMLGGLLDREEQQHESIPISGMTRENLTVLDRSTNKQYRFVLPGPILTDGEREECIRRIASRTPPPEFLVLSGSLPPQTPEDFYARVIRQAPPGSRIVLDTSGRALHSTVQQTSVYLLKPNLRELGHLAGTEIRNDEQIRKAATTLIREKKAAVLVVSLGAGGALLATEETIRHFRAPIVPIVSRVGAGDSMVGGILAGLLRREPVEEAVRLGVAAGAATVMTPGTELCNGADVERLKNSVSF